MQYCEHCMNLIEPQDINEDENECPYCGYHTIREAKENDYCHLISKLDIWKEVIEEIFEKYNIPYETINDKPRDKQTDFHLGIMNYDYYVQYKYYDYAYKVFNEMLYADSYMRNMN